MTTSVRSAGFRRRRNALLAIGAAVPLIALSTVTLPSFAADLVSVDWRVSGSGEQTDKIQGVIVEVAGQTNCAGRSGSIQVERYTRILVSATQSPACEPQHAVAGLNADFEAGAPDTTVVIYPELSSTSIVESP